ncbi:MAG: hypothetical protein PHW73_08615 [Atribacterota bacterium]|nr:hypothetical protein [Atribacterota bacterium]
MISLWERLESVNTALKVKVEPDKSVQIVIENQIKEESTRFLKNWPPEKGLIREVKIYEKDILSDFNFYGGNFLFSPNFFS